LLGFSQSFDDYNQPALAEEDSIDDNNNNDDNDDNNNNENHNNNNNETENEAETENKISELKDLENTGGDDDFETDGSTIFDLMTRSGFLFVAHSTFQLNSALRESPNETKHKSRIVVLEFVARWCGLCKFIEPQFEVRNKIPRKILIDYTF
jgi:hypothetical protein